MLDVVQFATQGKIHTPSAEEQYSTEKVSFNLGVIIYRWIEKTHLREGFSNFSAKPWSPRGILVPRGCYDFDKPENITENISNQI